MYVKITVGDYLDEDSYLHNSKNVLNIKFLTNDVLKDKEHPACHAFLDRVDHVVVFRFFEHQKFLHFDT